MSSDLSFLEDSRMFDWIELKLIKRKLRLQNFLRLTLNITLTVPEPISSCVPPLLRRNFDRSMSYRAICFSGLQCGDSWVISFIMLTCVSTRIQFRQSRDLFDLRRILRYVPENLDDVTSGAFPQITVWNFWVWKALQRGFQRVNPPCNLDLSHCSTLSILH